MAVAATALEVGEEEEEVVPGRWVLGQFVPLFRLDSRGFFRFSC